MNGLFISWVVGAILCTVLLFTHEGQFSTQLLGLVGPPSAYAFIYVIYKLWRHG